MDDRMTQNDALALHQHALAQGVNPLPSTIKYTNGVGRIRGSCRGVAVTMYAALKDGSWVDITVTVDQD